MSKLFWAYKAAYDECLRLLSCITVEFKNFYVSKGSRVLLAIGAFIAILLKEIFSCFFLAIIRYSLSLSYEDFGEYCGDSITSFVLPIYFIIFILVGDPVANLFVKLC